MSYSLGERVWAMVDGFPWWPAKVVSAEEVGAQASEDPEADICVQYYGTGDLGFFNSEDPEHILPFEESSQKCVTGDESLISAIEACSADVDAQPLRDDHPATGAQKSSANGLNGKSTQKITGRKRNRSPGKKKKSSTSHHHDDSDDDGPAQPEFRTANTSELKELKETIDTAAADNDISNLRKALLECAQLNVSFEQLKSTKIGVSVGDLFSKPEFRHVHALVHAIVCFWAMAMPAETKSALEQMQQLQAHHGGVEQPTVAAASTFGRTQGPTGGLGGAGVMEALRKSFAMFPAELAAVNIDADRVLAVAQSLADVLETDELKKGAVSHLRRAGHDELREKLLTGVLSPLEFAGMVPGDILTTEEQKKKDAQDALIDHTPQGPGGSFSEMFECPKCEQFLATFYEKQIRSADEPATIFLTCLKCKNQWTLN